MIRTAHPLGSATTAESLPILSSSANGVPGSDRQHSLFAIVDDRLRGRWRPALLCGAVLGLLASVVGFRLAPVRYVSTGTVHVAPRGLVILEETIDTRNIPKSEYDAFLRTQAMLIRDRRVAASAFEAPALDALPADQRPLTLEDLRSRLTARAEQGTELITVTYESESPGDATVILNAVLDSYDRIYGNDPKAQREQRLDVMLQMRSELWAQRSIRQQALQDFSAETPSGAAGLQKLLDLKMLHIEELAQELERADLEMKQVQPAEDAAPEMTSNRDLESFDPGLAELRLNHDMQRHRVEQLEFELNPDHPIVLHARRELDVLAALLGERREETTEAWLASAHYLVGTSGTVISEEQLQTYRERIEMLQDRYKAEASGIGRKVMRLGNLTEQLAETEGRLAEVEDGIRTHQLAGGKEELFSGRIKIISRGVEASTPSKDQRASMTACGLCGGFGASLAFFFLLGTIDRRAYSARQIRDMDAKVRCLGALPNLRGRTGELPDMDRAAQCVHQIRNRLETACDIHDGLVIAISSPDSGDGKTTLAMALAWSYAMAKHRTILVDADLVGRNVTRQTGHLEAPGLREVLKDRWNRPEFVLPIAPDLSLLPCGLDPTIGPATIRHDDFECLCQELRHDHDVVIIDTGPLTGSVELFPVLTATMGVVLIAQRGFSRARMDESLRTLEEMGVPVYGLVLNRASEEDCERYVSRSKVSNRRASATDVDDAPDHGARENILVKAMARSASLAD